ncbi:MAG: GtrA family protein [Prevotella sp.]|nr:GtrA family protein [Prevotella sp.]
MKNIFRLFVIRREERLLAALSLLLFLFLNGLVVYHYGGLFSQLRDNYRRFFVRNFHISGFDPLTYNVVTEWSTAYNVYRHPLLAFFMYPVSKLNQGLMSLTGVNCVQFLVAAILIFFAFYSVIFLYRIFREVIRLERSDALVLTVLNYSFAYVLLASMVPDHFILSMSVLILTLYICGKKMVSGSILTKWQTVLLFVLAAGISLNNGVKVFLAALFTNGKRFFHPVYLLLAVLLPSALMWFGARKEYEHFVFPDWHARKVAKANSQKRADEKAVRLYLDSMKNADSAQVAAGVREVLRRQADKRRQQDAQLVSNQHRGKPMGNGEFAKWTDISTSRVESLVHNLFGESVILHRDYLLQDTLVSRPVIVKYRWWWNYLAESAVVLLFLAGVWFGRRSRFLWMSLSFFAFDMLIHVGLGFGLNEVYIMSPHWMFVYPIAIAFIFKAMTARGRLCLRSILVALEIYLLVVNVGLITSYLL